jgi:tetraacyldisaccharide 4'-kinase
MNFLRKMLFPFAIIYGLVTSIRNFLYDKGILKSHMFDLPIIAVGNLSVGGTGKTPQIEYLIRLLSVNYKIATLSRGYKRKSEGFILADESSNAEILGDEPFQLYQKFKNIQVAVNANRKNGIEQLLSQSNKPEIILLDDAFQHRKVKAGFYILLTAYNDLYTNDFILPTGNLRESRSGAQRANVIVVTKCPVGLSEIEQNKIKDKLRLDNDQKVFFTFIDYDESVFSKNKSLHVSDLKNTDKLFLAGIAKPESFFAYLQSESNECLVYPDHHHFTQNDLIKIREKIKNKIIITTEKDFVRLSGKLTDDSLFYLPIKSKFVNNGNDFDKTILNYVGTCTRNSKLY